MVNKRKISKDLDHAIEHIINGNYELALTILQKAIERENGAIRKKDNGGV